MKVQLQDEVGSFRQSHRNTVRKELRCVAECPAAQPSSRFDARTQADRRAAAESGTAIRAIEVCDGSAAHIREDRMMYDAARAGAKLDGADPLVFCKFYGNC